MGRADSHRPAITRRPGKGRALIWPGQAPRNASSTRSRSTWSTRSSCSRGTWVSHRPATPCWRRPAGVPGSLGARQCAMAWTGIPSGWWPSGGTAPTGSGHRGEPARPGQVPQRFRRRLAGRDGAHPRRGRPARAAAAPGPGQPRAPLVRARFGGDGHQPADGTHRPGSPLILTRAAIPAGGVLAREAGRVGPGFLEKRVR
jgi:hypothetical protein